MQEIRFHLKLTAAEFLAFYQGAAREVVAKALDGRTVRFPAAVLRPFVAHDGVHGVFALRFDERNKFLEVVRVGVDVGYEQPPRPLRGHPSSTEEGRKKIEHPSSVEEGWPEGTGWLFLAR